MSKTHTIFYLPGVLLAAVILGLFGFSLLFSDFGVTETAWSRILLIVVYNLMVGWIIGYLLPRHAWVSGVAGWSGFALGIVAFPLSLIRLDPREILMSLLPGTTVLLTLLGGKIGALMRQKRN